jgi:MtN3 and saliva related transmembrane protein
MLEDTIKICADIFFMMGAFLNAALFVPQILLLYRTKNAQNVSLLMFLGFNFIQFTTALHGYISKDYILMLGYSLSFVTCGLVTMLILFYRKN